MKTLKNFGKISHKDYKFAFRECPEKLEENKKYLVSGIDNNILTKIGSNCWTGIICKNPLEKNKKHIWKIKILKSHKNNNSIIIGLAPENFDINNSKYINCGWYLCCCCGLLFSGEPHNYNSEKIVEKIIRGRRISKGNEQKNLFDFKSKDITLIMDMNKGSLKYVIDSQRAIEIYANIPTDKPLYPIIFLKYKGDKVIVTDNNWPKFVYQKIIKIQKKEKKT